MTNALRAVVTGRSWRAADKAGHAMTVDETINLAARITAYLAPPPTDATPRANHHQRLAFPTH